MTAATVRKQKNNKATAKFVVCGFIPGCEMVLETVGRKPYTTPSQQPDENMQKILEFLVKVDKTKESVQKFLDTYSSWLKERQGCIENIRKLADSIDFHHRNTNIAQLPASAAGITAGILTITGLALIPVTFGASLGLTITGAVLGAGATIAGVANSATDIGVRIDRSKKAKKSIDQHRESTEEMGKIIQEVLDDCEEVTKLATEEMMSIVDETLIRNGGEAARFTAVGLKNACSVGLAAVRTIPKAAKSLHLLRKGFGITAAAAASSLRTVDVASDAAGGAVKLVASTTGKVITGLGFAFSAIGIAADLVSAGVSIYDLVKGSGTSTSKQLRKVADNLIKEMENVKKMNVVLKSNRLDCDPENDLEIADQETEDDEHNLIT